MADAAEVLISRVPEQAVHVSVGEVEVRLAGVRPHVLPAAPERTAVAGAADQIGPHVRGVDADELLERSVVRGLEDGVTVDDSPSERRQDGEVRQGSDVWDPFRQIDATAPFPVRALPIDSRVLPPPRQTAPAR